MDCLTKIVDGQYAIETCSETGAEGIWTGSESGSRAAWIAEHFAAHRRVEGEIQQRRVAIAMRGPRRGAYFGGYCTCGKH